MPITPVSQKEMRLITAEIAVRDKKLARIIAAHPLCTIGQVEKPVTHFESLVESVISQQLAVKAAETIYLRVKKLAGGKVTPTRISVITEREMR
jgi:DNA-3-methyladenine glycosylase II